MKTSYDYIVLGCGGIGSGAAYWLSRQVGAEVLGLEQFALGHIHGGSQDHSRIIRLTYHHEDYTKLTPHAYTAWATLEEESAVQLVINTGSIELAAKNGLAQQDIETYAQAMDVAHIPYERFGADEVMRRYPQFKLEEEVDALWQADTGLVDAIKGNAAHISIARYHGATILDRCGVESIQPFAGGVNVETNKGTFSCRKLIVTAGAWLDKVLADVGINLSITTTQEQITYYATPNLKEFAIGNFPIFLWHGADVFYGFPVYGEVATKGSIDAVGPPVTPDTRSYDPDPALEKKLTDWLAQYIPGFLGPKLYSKTCLYAMPKDRNFVIDTVPEHPQIIICSGAGHAYKFASLLGKILSQLATKGQTEYPIAPFTLNRPAITNPNYQAAFHI